MLINGIDYEKWRKEQIKYFKKHLRYLDKNTSEYAVILKGIKELEKY